jgi:L-seryl-tRNA(Ser) seleniumtransferase
MPAGFAQSRRQWFRDGSLLATALSLSKKVAAAPLQLGSRLYESIGVKPLINARGTFTIITGSQTLEEVKQAMDEGSRHFVQMDELMDAVGARLAEISGAEWGIITNGCCAAIAHCTAAAIAGSNPERMQQLPDLTGLKNEVIIPSYSRNVYDHAVRMVGVKIVEVGDPAQLEAAFNERTAMVYILGCLQDDGPLGTRVIAPIAKRRGVPVLVDAAAEVLTLKPNVHLARGATAVAYSGGKCIRGPQSAGLLLGEKEWLQAAWANSAPHHAFGRSMKVGKEEIMGMLAAVEMWTKRDHAAEWRQWEARLAYIASQAEKVPGVAAKITQPSPDLSNRSPRLTLSWDAAKLGLTGPELAKALLDGDPRIVVAGSTAGSVSFIPYQMIPGDEKPVAARVSALLSHPPTPAPEPPAPSGPPAEVAGQWDVRLQFGRGAATHNIVLEQHGNTLQGTHRGEFFSGDLNGSVAGNTVKFHSSHRVHGTRLSYDFSGVVDAGKITGAVNMGEYGIVHFTAERHPYRQPNHRG